MKRSLLIVASLFLAATAHAGPAAGDRLFSITGTGSSDNSFDNTQFGATGELGWFTTDMFAWGVRQSVNILARDNADNSYSGVTRVFGDYHFGTRNTLPFVGASIGGLYGDDSPESFIAGVEAGLKYYVKPKTYISFAAEYQFLFEDAADTDDNFDDGAFFYSLGVGFNF